MWLHKPPEFTVPVLVPETMRDTITRCLKDGWVECADPRLPVEATDEALMPSLTVPTDASTAQVPSAEPEQAERVRRTVPVKRSAPSPVTKPTTSKPTAKARR